MKYQVALKGLTKNDIVLSANLTSDTAAVFLAHSKQINSYVLCLTDDIDGKDYAVPVSKEFATAFIREFGQSED